MSSIENMHEHMSIISERLTVDIDMINALQAELILLRNVAEMFLKRAGLSKSENVKEVMDAGTGFFYAFTNKMFGQSYNAHARAQRLSTLEAMMPVFNASLTFLGSVIIELGQARGGGMRCDG